MEKRNNHGHDNQVENILRLIKDRMNNLNEEIDKHELMKNFDTLLDKKINKEDIESIKKFVIFCYDKINKYWVQYIEQKNFSDKCVNQINSLKQKVEKLERQIARLEQQIAGLENDKNEMTKEINRLNINMGNKINHFEKEKAKQIKKLDNLHFEFFNLNQKNLLLEKSMLEQKNDLCILKQKNDILTKNNNTLEENNSSLKDVVSELQKKVTSLENNNNIILNENKTKKNEISELQKKVTSLENNNNIILNENKTKKNEISELQKKYKELEKKNSALEKNNISLEKKINTLIEKANNLNLEVKNINTQLISTTLKNIDLVQEKQEINKTIDLIKERDNMNAIIYIILISTGKYNFGDIWYKIKEITKKYSQLDLSETLKILLFSADKLLIDGNEEAHLSLRINIIKTLFPNLDDDLQKRFSDDLINRTKKIIHGMKNYIINEKSDVIFRKKMDDLSNDIKKIFCK